MFRCNGRHRTYNVVGTKYLYFLAHESVGLLHKLCSSVLWSSKTDKVFQNDYFETFLHMLVGLFSALVASAHCTSDGFETTGLHSLGRYFSRGSFANIFPDWSVGFGSAG